MTSLNQPVRSRTNIFKAFNLCLVLSLLASGFYFLKSLDDVMVKNLELEQLKGRLGSLENKNREMETLKHDLESYENINSRLDGLNMVKVSQIEYLSPDKDSLAKR